MKTHYSSVLAQTIGSSNPGKDSPMRILLFIRRVSVLTIIIFLSASMPCTSQTSDDMRAVLITGTSSGIGLKMTEVLSENGFFVYAGVRTPEDYARLNALNNVQAVQLDVTIQSEIDAAVKFVRSEGRGLYGLINNAGIATMEPLIEHSEKEMDLVLDVNLLGPYRITKAFSDLIIESQGRIMTTSSIAGILSGQFMGAYSMSKHGVEAFTDALAAEMQAFDVEVAAVEPGNYKSQIVASMVKRMKSSDYSAENSRYGNLLEMISAGPLDRSQYQEPDDVAFAALHFLTSETPKRRYMVVPNQSEAEMTIRQVLTEMVQLNEGHQYTFSRDKLVEMLDQILGTPVAASSMATSNVTIHEAAMTGNIQAVQRLIKDGSDLNVREPMGGSSPLITAASFGHTNVAKELINAGADLDLKNNDGSTALITAAFFCRTEIVEMLIAAGADKNVKNYTGSNALDVVSAPFDTVKAIYDFIGQALGPFGLKLDYERIKATRPKIAEILR